MHMRLPRLLRAVATLGLLLAMAACGAKVELHHGLQERDANEVIAALQLRGIAASKVANKQGYSVSLAESDLATAVSVLQESGLPRSTYSRMGEVFRKDGMISTPAEERGRYLYALSQELESTLSQIDGVVLARVHPVLQERVTPGEAALQPSCAVMIKYRAGWDPDAYEDRIRRLVMAGIPGLAATSPERISIVFVAASEEDTAAPSGHAPAGASAKPAVQSGSPSVVLWLLGALVTMALLGGGVLAWYQRQRAQTRAAQAPVIDVEDDLAPDAASPAPAFPQAAP